MQVFAHLQRAGSSRGDVIQALNDRLFRDLAMPGGDPAPIYEDYLAARNAGYMQIESGSGVPREPTAWSALTGYDKIALSVVRAIRQNSNAIIPLNVTNEGNLADLEPDDVVEVPCVVNSNGARALHVGRAPDQIRDLLLQVKEYERLTVRAALSGQLRDAENALARNPLVADPDLAARLVEAFSLA